MHAGKLEEIKVRERTVAIETYTHLRGDVREQERLIHGFLRGHKSERAREKVAQQGGP